METQSSLANDVRDVEQAGTMQDFIVRYEVVPSDVQCNYLTLENHRTQKMTNFAASNILFCE